MYRRSHWQVFWCFLMLLQKNMIKSCRSLGFSLPSSICGVTLHFSLPLTNLVELLFLVYAVQYLQCSASRILHRGLCGKPHSRWMLTVQGRMQRVWRRLLEMDGRSRERSEARRSFNLEVSKMAPQLSGNHQFPRSRSPSLCLESPETPEHSQGGNVTFK